MTPAFLQLVVRQAACGVAANSSDAELLRTLVVERRLGQSGERSFAELLRRHGPMVWAACRQLLPEATDAEDAFQAVFVALLRNAAAVRNPAAVGGWLHGVAVNVANKVKRSAVRRKQRERKMARSESENAVPNGSWDVLLAAVHDEINRLPAFLRTAFVICELEGVRQPEAAKQLGWKPGTLTGRLTRARQLLLERLLGRGLAPAGAVATVAFGATASAVPPTLIDTALSHATVGGTIPSTILKLVKEVTPMVISRTKLLAAAVLVASGLTLGFGSTLMPMVQAQPTPSTSGSSTGGTGGSGPSSPKFTPDPNNQPQPDRTTGGKAGQPGFGGSTWGADSSLRFPAGPQAARYRYIGKPRSAIEFAKLMDDEAVQGYDFVAVVNFENAELRAAAKERPSSFFNIGTNTNEVAIFKARPAQAPIPATPMTPRPGPGFGPPSGTGFDPRPMTGPGPLPSPGGNRPAGSPPPDADRGGSIGQSSTNLKNADARDVQKVLREYFEKKGSSAFVAIVPDENRIIVSGDAKDVAEANKIIGEMDASASKPGTNRPTPPTSNAFPPAVPAPPANSEPVFIVIAIKHADAADIGTVLQQVFAKDGPQIVVENRSNSLIIVKADPKTTEALKALIEKLDVPISKETPLPKVKR